MGSLGRYHKLICWFLSDCCFFSRSWSHKVWYPELKTPRKEVFQKKQIACQKNGIQKRSPEKIMPNIYLFQLSNYFFWILPLFLLPSEFLLHPWMLVFIQPAGQVGFGVPPNLGGFGQAERAAFRGDDGDAPRSWGLRKGWMRMSKSINHWAQWVGGDCFFFWGGRHLPIDITYLLIVHPSFFCLSGCGGGGLVWKKEVCVFVVLFLFKAGSFWRMYFKMDIFHRSNSSKNAG